MKRTLFLLFTFVVTVAIIAGGTAFLLRQRQLGDLGRLAAQAEDKMRDKAYDDATLMLRKVEQRGGTSRSAYLLGKIYWEQEKPGEALPWFNKVATEYPKSDYVGDALLYKARYKLNVEKDTAGGQEVLLRILANHPKSEANDFALVELSRLSLVNNNEEQAKKNLDIIMKKPESPAKADAEFLVGDLNMRALKSPTPGVDDEVYTIKRGDSLWKMERELKVPSDLLITVNNLNPRSLSVGTQIKVPRVDFSLIVDKPNRVLILRNRGSFLKKYKVGIHNDDAQLPASVYSVIKKYDKGMEWTDPATNQTVKPGEPNNPYGNRFVELRRGVGIHGTNDPERVGTYMNKGFVSMTNDDIEEVYGLVQVKTPVTVRGRVKSEVSPGKR